VMEGAELVHLSTGRDLLPTTLPRRDAQPALLMANPDYGPPVQEAADAGASRGGVRALRDISFVPLPATLEEAASVRKSLGKATMLTGAAATRAVLAGVRGPRVLHLATHGFFLPDASTGLAETAPTDGSRGLKLRKGAPPEDAAVLAEEGVRVVLNPMASAGVALAGANRAAGAGREGVMTAAEVATLDLRGTQLVVLSACQTGLGERVGGDGVLGLRRALVQAGSQTQVLSLWNVDDDATRDLMTAYYEALARGAGRSAAMRMAQQRLQKGRWSHPYYWAAFVVSGDWRPLRK
jgi:CHAT domain-containing protein